MNEVKYRIGKNNDGVIGYITEKELKDIKDGKVGKDSFTHQQWAKIRKMVKKLDI